ncbi:MAG: tetratricopeptide repeat protein, partial [bacterium]
IPEPQKPGSKNYSSSIPGFPMPEPQIPGREQSDSGGSSPSPSGGPSEPKTKSYSDRYREFYSSPNYGQRYRDSYNSSTYRRSYRSLGNSYFATGGDSRKRLQYPGSGGFTDPYAPGMDDSFDAGNNEETWGIDGLNRHPLDSGGLFDRERRSLNVPSAQNPALDGLGYTQFPSLNPLLQPPMLIPPHYIYPMNPIAETTAQAEAEWNTAAAGLPGGATAPETPRIIDATAAIQPKPASAPSSPSPGGNAAPTSPATASPGQAAASTPAANPPRPAPPAPRITSPQDWLYQQSIEAFTFRNYAKARDTLERLITMTPDSPRVYFAYGLSLFYMGQYNEAAAALEHSVTLSYQTRTPLPSLQSLRLNPYDFRYHHRRLARYLEENPRDVNASTLFYLLTRAAG